MPILVNAPVADTIRLIPNVKGARAAPAIATPDPVVFAILQLVICLFNSE